MLQVSFLPTFEKKIIDSGRFEKTSIRMARGLSAVCLLVILVVVAYDVLVIQPFSNQVRIPSVRYFGQGDPLPLSNKPCVVLIVGALIQTPGNLHHLIC